MKITDLTRASSALLIEHGDLAVRVNGVAITGIEFVPALEGIHKAYIDITTEDWDG